MMEKLALLLCLPFLFFNCNRQVVTEGYTSRKFHNKKIAILPFKIHSAVKELPEGVTMKMIDKAERNKCKVMQRDLYRYMLRSYAKSSRKVVLQHFNDTNDILKKKGMTYEKIFELSKRDLAKLLKVDALIYGNVYQSKQRLNLDGEGTVRNVGVGNSISTVIYVYGRSKRDRIQWKDDRSQSGFPSDYAPEVVKGLLRKAAASFPF